MSGSASIVTSLPGLFMACIQCFEIIQYGRTLETERDSCPSPSKGIIGTINPQTIDAQLEECRPSLQAIITRFDDAKRKSERYKLNKQQQQQQGGRPPENNSVLQLEEPTQSPGSSFRNATKKLMKKYVTKYDNAVTRTKWAIYERKVLENLVSNLRSDVEDLIELFPERVARPVDELIVEEVQELDDTALPVMQQISHVEQDQAMEEAATAEIKKREQGGHTFDNFDVEGQDGLQFRAGDDIEYGATPSGPGNSYSKFKIHGSGTVNTGNKWHGKPT
ncbi:uncharacterized protein N0V89_001542 [Didymosphaeria variabile]|uniref:Prion-inhibition and propagation HeLo domain-containing protein n=1 Tax=Didymosphaeria variabile TaxID=1932322 RepID=A0A9W8XWS3_9PLEO|nr:uncharacterized protein N0V89_001542 [Didymosphaeria variabile]KAJ4360973.1 hypothetical protein N0V89_001542 [Didymosphaeria variabile]